jgi:uncharacterized membrane protein
MPLAALSASIRPAPAATECMILRPHASLSPRQACGLFAGLAAFMTVMIVLFLYRGAWPVALCFVLTLFACGAGLVVTCRRARDCDRLEFDEARLRIIQCRGRHEVRHEFQRYWARVVLEPVRDGWYPSRLMIRSHGRAVEVGACLNEDERQLTARRLRALLGSACHDSGRQQEPD